MATIVPSGEIEGVFLVEPAIHGDERGIFVETYRRQWFPNGREMIQGNRGDRKAGAWSACTTTSTRPTTGTCPSAAAGSCSTTCASTRPPRARR